MHDPVPTDPHASLTREQRDEEEKMAGPGRNDPCPCGSGLKAKRCCGLERGPSEEQLARARLATLSHEATRELVDLSDQALDQLQDDLFDLPGVDLSLHVKLPELTGSERKRLQRAITDPDDDDAWEHVTGIAGRVDTPQQRVALAEALIRLRAQGLVSRRQAAFAIYDLGNGGMFFMTVSAIHTLATYVGGDPTPAGLLVAA
jgi:hypothetical protein